MSPATRRRWRRRLLLAGLLPLLVAVGFATKVALMLVAVESGRSSYSAGAYAVARDRFAAGATLNLLEPWVALFDEGTARFRLDDFTGAVRLLTEALVTVPPGDECRVRVNLALSYESLGDAALADGEREVAGEAWRAGTGVLREGGCLTLAGDAQDVTRLRDPAGATSTDQRRDARAVDRRLRDKQRSDRTVAVEDDPDDPVTQAEAAERAARLEQRNERAQQQRLRDAQRKEDREAERDREPPPPPGSGETDEDREPRVYEW